MDSTSFSKQKTNCKIPEPFECNTIGYIFVIICECKHQQEFRRIVLCHQLWLKTEADEIQNDKNYAGHK